MPTARDEAAISRFLGILFINMKGLRIPFLRKLDDFFRRDNDLSQIINVVYFIVFSVARQFFGHGKRLSVRFAKHSQSRPSLAPKHHLQAYEGYRAL
jgi:hypothetical protein